MPFKHSNHIYTFRKKNRTHVDLAKIEILTKALPMYYTRTNIYNHIHVQICPFLWSIYFLHVKS